MNNDQNPNNPSPTPTWPPAQPVATDQNTQDLSPNANPSLSPTAVPPLNNPDSLTLAAPAVEPLAATPLQPAEGQPVPSTPNFDPFGGLQNIPVPAAGSPIPSGIGIPGQQASQPQDQMPPAPPASSSIFPPQFSQNSTDQSLTTTGISPLPEAPSAFASPASTWPSAFPPVDSSQLPSPVVTPPQPNQTTPNPFSQAANYSAAQDSPTVPDFLAGGGFATTGNQPQPNFSPTNPPSQTPDFASFTGLAGQAAQAPTADGINSPPVDGNPTDLSGLASTATSSPPTQDQVYTPSVTGADNTVSVAPAGIPATTVTDHPKSNSVKYIIISALVLIVLIIGGAAYAMFFSNGKSNPEQSLSLPAQQAPLTNPPKQVVAPSPASTTASASPQATSSATSAYDFLKDKAAPKSAK